MLIRAEEAIQKANRVLRQCGTRNADRIARELGLIVMPRDFSRQKGAYMVIERNRYIFINKHLDPVMHDIVLLHEIGHDCLHRREAIQVGGLQEFNILYGGYDVGQIARIMCSDINLVALKVSELNMQGHRFREQEHRSSFLK